MISDLTSSDFLLPSFLSRKTLLICSPVMNAVLKAVEMLVKGCQLYWTLAMALVRQGTWASV